MRSLSLIGLGLIVAACGARPIDVETPEVAALGSECGTEGVEACERACQEGDAEACMVAAHAYEQGKGTRVDKERMAALEAAACELGLALGCVFHSNNRGLPLAVRQASAMKGCELGDAKGCAKAAPAEGVEIVFRAAVCFEDSPNRRWSP